MHQISRHLLVFLFTLLLGLSSFQVVPGSPADLFGQQGDGNQIANVFDTGRVIFSGCTGNQNYAHCGEDLDHIYSSYHCATCALALPSAVLNPMIPATISERSQIAEGIFKGFSNLLFRPPKI